VNYIFNFVFILAVCFFLPYCAAASDRSAFIDYKVDTIKIDAGQSNPGKIYIQSVNVQSGNGLNGVVVKNINSALRVFLDEFKVDANRCAKVMHTGPWGYYVKFEKVIYSREYLSFVFEKQAVCANSPIDDKESLVVSRESGFAVPKDKMFMTELPHLIKPQLTTKGRLRLADSALDKMLKDSTKNLGGVREGCDLFLRGTSYSAWVDWGTIILYPEFIQSNSYCQKEYTINTLE